MKTLGKIIAASPLTYDQIAERMGVSRGYVFTLKKLQEKGELEDLYRLAQFAEILGCKKWELLPDEWQRPAGNDLDNQLLESMLERVIKEMQKLSLELDPHVIAGIAASFYEETLENRDAIKDENIRFAVKYSTKTT